MPAIVKATLVQVTISSDAYPPTPQVGLGYTPTSVLITNRSADTADVVLISFDGVTDHGLLDQYLRAAPWHQPSKQVWLRAEAVPDAPFKVAVQAEGAYA